MGWTYVLGGIGLFLLGMSMMTDGLKELADDALRKWLNRFTGGTIRAIFSGALITLLIQSSSAATIITIGFVSAGLISFTQSIGIIIGANIGTTSIGWIISLVGFKISLTSMSLPIIGAGALFRVFARKAIKPYGSVLTGFGLLFLGLANLQEGMVLQEDILALNILQGESFLYLILLVLIGFIMTVILQSSSASIATTLTFLHVGAITFEQGIFLVIGHNIGTTVTALFAAIGASVSAKRTALTHVLFNLGTATVITLLYPLFISLTVFLSTLINGTFDAVLGIAVFHTLFSLVGALVFVPFIHPFAKLVKRILPEKGNPLTQYLDKNVATVPAVALEAAYKTLIGIINELTEEIIFLVRFQKTSDTFEKTIEKIEEAIVITREFLDSLHPHSMEDQNRLLSQIHALDHLDRLIKVLKEEQRIEAISLHHNLMGEWIEILERIPLSTSTDELIKVASSLENISTVIAEERRVKRNKYFLQSVRSETELETALAKVQALLWIDRLAYHYWRGIHRLTDSATVEDLG
ncbi:MAG: Na/Pi symporter [Desulfitobacterium sp.]|nr:Na/Pi symporter [Desulfitobacterium sp.]